MILENSKLVFAVFIILGFLLPQAADDLKFLLLPMLVVMMTLSIKDAHIGHFSRANYKRMIGVVLINYFLMTPILIILAKLFITNETYLYGCIILASVPPAAAIIPLAHLYHGDIKDSILGEIACYLFALVYSPTLVYLLLGEKVEILIFIKLLFLMILLPLLLGRLIHNVQLKINHRLVINLIFGVSFYIFIGLNRDIFFKDWQEMLRLVLLFILITFGLSTVIFRFLKHEKVKKTQDIMYVLFGTFKNGNGAATIAIALFGPAAAVPVAVRGMILPFYFMFLSYLFNQPRDRN